MSMNFHKVVTFLLALLMVCLYAPVALADPDPVNPVFSVDEEGALPAGAVNAEAAVCYDVNTDTLLWALNEDERLFPASITKVMTCLVVLEYAAGRPDGLQETVKSTSYYNMEEGAVGMYIKKGEVFTLEQLVYALMLKSANDAALLLADHIGGSMPGFADMMNAKAAELGMTGTHYVTPNGLHDSMHYTTARDMTKVMKAALENETFRQIIATKKYVIPKTNKETARTCNNSNRLLDEDNAEFYYSYCLGGKTGYTGAAGYTFTCYGEKDGRTVIAVVLKAPTTEIRFASGRNLLRYGLEYFETKDMAPILTAETLKAQVSGSLQSPDAPVEVEAEQVTGETCVRLVRREVLYGASDPANYNRLVLWDDDLTAPIAEGQRLGVVQYRFNDELVLTCELKATQSLEAAPTSATSPTTTTTLRTDPVTGEELPPPPTLKDWLGENQTLVLMLVGLILVLIAVIIIALALAARKRRKAAEAKARQSFDARRDMRRATAYQRASSRKDRRRLEKK